MSYYQHARDESAVEWPVPTIAGLASRPPALPTEWSTEWSEMELGDLASADPPNICIVRGVTPLVKTFGATPTPPNSTHSVDCVAAVAVITVGRPRRTRRRRRRVACCVQLRPARLKAKSGAAE